MKRIRFFFTVMVMLLASASAFAQNITVGGVVTDTNDEPVIGATVMVAGTQTGTSTDVDGAFSIKGVEYIGGYGATIELKNGATIENLGNVAGLEYTTIVEYVDTQVGADLTETLGYGNTEDIFNLVVGQKLEMNDARLGTQVSYDNYVFHI